MRSETGVQSRHQCFYIRPRNRSTLCDHVRRIGVFALTGEPLLWAINVTKSHDGSVCQFKNESITLHRGEKVAILGPNGSGKSTLLSVLAGTSTPDSGSVQLRKGVVAAIVAQTLPTDLDSEMLASRAILSLASRHAATPAIRAAERNVIATAAVASACNEKERNKALSQLSAATVQMDAQPGAWLVDSYLTTMLDRFQIPDSVSLSALSGGQRRRVAIAAALLAQPQVLFLDEVTNHLSVDAIEYLEDILADPSLTVVTISHDRAFVDNVCTTAIWELDGELHRYPPGYDNFLDAKASRLASEERLFAGMRKALRKEIEWLRKQPKARGTKSKSRVDDAHKLETAVKQRAARNDGRTAKVRKMTASVTRLGGDVVTLQDVTLQRGSTLVLKDFSYSFERGERVGIVGENGVGKSSLLRALLGQVPLESGSIQVGETVVFGHFDQEGIDLSEPLSEGITAALGAESAEDMRIIDYVSELVSLNSPKGNLTVDSGGDKNDSVGIEAHVESQLEQLSYSISLPVSRRIDSENNSPLRKMSPIALLSEFGFDRNKQRTFVRHLSGGERRRLQLMALLLRNANFLVLDEVTNDLDVNTLTMVEEALEEYTGVLVLCSHDRFMLDRLVNHLLVIEGDGKVTLVEGKFSDYLSQKRELAAEARRERKLHGEAKGHVSGSGKEMANGSTKSSFTKGGKRKLSFKERKEYERLEAEIDACQQEYDDLSERLAVQGGTAGHEELASWSTRLAQIERDVEQKTERWMELAEAIDD